MRTPSNRSDSICVGHPQAQLWLTIEFVIADSLRPPMAVFPGGLSMRKYVLALCLHIICGLTVLQAQTPTATLSGIVKDARGALMRGAHVTLTNVAQDTTRESSTNS